MSETDIGQATTKIESSANGIADQAAAFAADAANNAGLTQPLDEHRSLRRQANRKELRLAAHNLAESLRGFIRVAPLTSALLAIAIGSGWANRRAARRARRMLPRRR